jgi:hypothetical protein
MPWPDQPRAPIVVPIEPPAGVSAPPAVGPYSGGFKPGGGS